jgi:hypothetical protein
MGLFGQPQIIKDYQRLRAVGRALIGKINDEVVTLDFDPVKAAKKLTLPVEGRTIIFDDADLDSAALMDFFLHEFRTRGRRPIDCCDPDRMGLSADERDLLAAHKSARSSLYEVAGVDKQTARLTLRDVLEPERPEVSLSDIALSSCDVAGKILIFIRLVECQGIQMTSGSFFTFSADLRETLLEAFHERMKTVPPSERAQRACIFFFQRHKAYGEEQAFADE